MCKFDNVTSEKSSILIFVNIFIMLKWFPEMALITDSYRTNNKVINNIWQHTSHIGFHKHDQKVSKSAVILMESGIKRGCTTECRKFSS
jgi:hypothetical protein